MNYTQTYHQESRVKKRFQLFSSIFMKITGVLVTLILALFILLPIVVICIAALWKHEIFGIASEQWIEGANKSDFSFAYVIYVWNTYHEMIFFSLKLAFFAVVLCAILGIVSSFAIASSTFKGRAWLEALILSPISIPGIAMSVALIQCFGIIRGNWTLVLMGHLVYTFPFMYRTLKSELESRDIVTLNRVAQTLGANLWKRLILIGIPSMRRGLLSGSLMVFTISWGEFNVSYLLNTPLNQGFPAAMYSAFTFSSFRVSCSATLLFLVILFPALLLLHLTNSIGTSNDDSRSLSKRNIFGVQGV